VQLDFAPLVATAEMLYNTSFVAERYSGIRHFIEAAEGGGAAVGTDERFVKVTRAIIARSGAGGCFAWILARAFFPQKCTTTARSWKELSFITNCRWWDSPPETGSPLRSGARTE
jgi:hypothetical protein